ncbi:salmochelin biosynthesis C-glycosyltransferase IroB [Saccharopolyspora rosea]|uniref:Nucleotide disphospho-sugar-binding domain-containing protein n=1 Tax=Saccharopolyspora rosea TaxID=524884 RepID=A0ABW3FRN6_9PSEU
MRILFTAAPGYGLMLPIVPLIWAARAAGHEVLVATTGEMTEVGARAGLPVVDVYPERDIWELLLRHVGKSEPDEDAPELTEEHRLAMRSANPFGLFTVTMTEGSIEAGRAFGPDLVVFTSDHVAGRLTAQALGVPALEVGNRISWSMRDADWREERGNLVDDEVTTLIREKLGIPAELPRVVARIDPRAPSMRGLVADETDPRDGVPWWPMRFVPFNGGAVLPEWALHRPERPRVCVTLGTVVPIMNGTSNLSVVIEALGGMDVEVVLAAGKADLSELGALPDNVHSVGFLPLSGFLPTCSLIVHHGGSGTTAAPLHYGVPQLVLPAFADNPMSAERVVERGVGLSHDPTTVDVDTVRELAGRLLTEPAFAAAAEEVSAEMAAQPAPTAVIERVTAALS